MRYILSLILLSTLGYGQVILNPGGIYYAWTAVTGTNLVTSTDVFLYGSYTRAQTTNVLGAPSASKYIRWGIGSLTDSTRTLAKALSLSDLTQDETYLYDCSVRDRDGRYSQGADSSFVTPFPAPAISDGESLVDTVIIYITDNSSGVVDTFFVQKADTLGQAYSNVDTLLTGDTTYYYETTAMLTYRATRFHLFDPRNLYP